MSLEIFLILACLIFPLREKIPQKSLWGCWVDKVLFSSESALNWQGAADSICKGEIVSPTSFPLDSFGHSVWIIVQDSQGFPWRSRLFMEIMVIYRDP
jgi:hypothetical protein